MIGICSGMVLVCGMLSMNDVRSFQNGNPLPMHLVSQFSHASPGCSTFYMASCLTWQVNGSYSSFVFHFVPQCFPAVPLDPEMVNQPGFSMEIHRNPMRFRPSLPLYLRHQHLRIPFRRRAWTSYGSIRRVRCSAGNFSWHSLIICKIAKQRWKTWRTCHSAYSTTSCQMTGTSDFFWGVMEIPSCSRKRRAAAARLGRNQ